MALCRPFPLRAPKGSLRAVHTYACRREKHRVSRVVVASPRVVTVETLLKVTEAPYAERVLLLDRVHVVLGVDNELRTQISRSNRSVVEALPNVPRPRLQVPNTG